MNDWDYPGGGASPEDKKSWLMNRAMTNSTWKPVAHKGGCKFGIETVGESCWRDCSGTRWHGYGERVGDFAGVWALTGWLAGLSKPEPVAFCNETALFWPEELEGAHAYVLAGLRPLYAAPVQPAAAQPARVWQDAEGTIPAGIGDPVGRVDMPDGVFDGAALVQPDAGKRPTLVTAAQPVDRTVILRSAEELIGTGSGAWDCVNPLEIVGAVLEAAGIAHECSPAAATQPVAVPDEVMRAAVARLLDVSNYATEQQYLGDDPSPWDEVRAILATRQPSAQVPDDVVRDGGFHVPTLEAVLRGLKSEDDSTQLRAIISEVQTMLSAAARKGEV